MKIVLKNADFSQSGIPAPYEVTFDGSKYLNIFTGVLESNSNTLRGADTGKIPMRDNKIKNTSSQTITLGILFYDSSNNYLGCGADTGSNNTIVAAGGTRRIDQLTRYRKPISSSQLQDMTEEEIASLKANAAYWRISAQATSGSISDVSVSLEIIG